MSVEPINAMNLPQPIHPEKPIRRRWLQHLGAASLGMTGVLAGTATQAQSSAQPSGQAALVLGDQARGLRALFEASRTLDGAPFAWRQALANREAYVQVYTQLTRLLIDASRIITGRAAIAARRVTQADVTALQTVADRSARDGILPTRVDVAAITDAQVWRGAA